MTVTPAQIKGLFFHLVKAAGGVEAAGAFLDVSHQRISQLQSVNSADLPNLIQITTLEGVVGQAIVTAALARAATGGSVSCDPMQEAGDIIEASAEVFSLVRKGNDPKTIKTALIRLQDEVTHLDEAIGGGAG